MNFDRQHSGGSKATYLAGLQAEGGGVFSYVPSPISEWERLRADGYAGPKVMWTENLSRHGIDYSQSAVPECKKRISTSIEMAWNYPDEDRNGMRNLADAFCKVEENLEQLKKWENS